MVSTDSEFYGASTPSTEAEHGFKGAPAATPVSTPQSSGGSVILMAAGSFGGGAEPSLHCERMSFAFRGHPGTTKLPEVHGPAA